MKELSTEEKARAYDEALERAKAIYQGSYKPDTAATIAETLQYVFPVLKESKDERMRKAIIIYLDWLDGRKDWAPRGEYSIRDMVAWLEKQDKQKPFDYEHANIQQKDFAPKVEPKFKVGDWVVLYPKVVQISRVERCQSNMYWTTEGTWFGDGTDARLWTIKDAKDGDVLAEDSCIFIIQKLDKDITIAKTYCVLYNDGYFGDGSILYFDIDNTKPATKEQRDILFAKMHEAGYEWDANKKELIR